MAMRTALLYGSRAVPGRRQELQAAIENGLLRPGPDAFYADGDDASWRSIDWPALTRRVVVGGRSVNLVDTGGDGPPLLFVHGLGGYWQNWLLNIPAFMRTHRVDRARSARVRASAMPRGGDLDPRLRAGREELLEALGVDSAAVVGNSMGGFVGAQLAISFPTRVERLVLVSAAGLSIENRRRSRC